MQSAVFDGMGEVVSLLSKRYTLAINSSTMGGIVDDFLKQKQLREYFSEINGPEVSMSKVDKFNKVFRDFGAMPKDCVFVTDTLGDLREAQIADVPSIAVTWGYHDLTRLKQGDTIAIVNTPNDLERVINNHFNIDTAIGSRAR